MTTSQPHELPQKYQQVLVLSRDMSEVKKRSVELTAERICGPNVTQDQQSIIYTIFDKFEPFREKINQLLFGEKCADMIKDNKISKQTITFLSSITDGDLEILKEQFKYVNRQAAIPAYNNIRDLFKLNERDCGDVLKFHKDIWIGEGVASRKAVLDWKIKEISSDGTVVILNNDYEYNEENLEGNRDRNIELLKQGKFPFTQIGKKTICIPHQNKPFELRFQWLCFTQLTEIGRELYQLLQDEIKPMPDDFINNVFEYHKTNNGDLNLELVDYDQSPKAIL